METLLTILVPLFGAMLLPVWIPLIGVAVGAVLDRVRTVPVTPAEQVVNDAKVRSAERRARPSLVPAAPTHRSAGQLAA